MKNIIFVCAIFAWSDSFALDTRISSSGTPSSCTVRMSNSQIKQSVSFSGGGVTGFCSGTLVAPDMIVTAAHCLNEAVSNRISDLSDVDRGVRLNLAVNTEAISKSYEVNRGEEAAVYGDQLKTHSQRERFIREGNIALVGEDFVILKLKEAVSSYNSASCPRLPTESDCEAFAEYEADAEKDAGDISATFYATAYHETGHGAAKIRTSYPSNRLIRVVAVDFARAEGRSHLLANFSVDSGGATLTKGDSGSGLIWNKDGESILVGVQSAVTSSNRSRGLFSRSCGFTGHSNWP